MKIRKIINLYNFFFFAEILEDKKKKIPLILILFPTEDENHTDFHVVV